MKFKLPRKKKKLFKKHAGIMYKNWLNKEDWEWFYFKRRVEVRCMEVVLKSTDSDILSFYKENYPDDKLSHHYCLQNRHRWDKFNINAVS